MAKIAPQLHIPVGLPGCGKSTWSDRLKAIYPSGVNVVSTDAIRLKLKKDRKLDIDTYYPDLNGPTFKEFHEDIFLYLSGWNARVVADATNLEASARENLRDQVAKASDHRAKFGMGTPIETHVVVFTNIEEAFARNVQRTGWARVPDEVMIAMLAKFEQTMTVIEQEPFTTITYIERIGVAAT